MSDYEALSGWDDRFNGTSLSGYLDISYGELVLMFGRPQGPTPDGKTTAEWLLIIDGHPVSIYNYKPNVFKTQERDWHVGGHRGAEDVQAVRNLLL